MNSRGLVKHVLQVCLATWGEREVGSCSPGERVESMLGPGVAAPAPGWFLHFYLQSYTPTHRPENVTQVSSTIVTGKSLWKFSKYTPLKILLCWQQENNQLEKPQAAKAASFVLIFLYLVLLVCVWALPLLGSAGTYLALPGHARPCHPGPSWPLIIGLLSGFSDFAHSLTDEHTLWLYGMLLQSKIIFKYFEYFHNIFNILHHVSKWSCHPVFFFKTLQWTINEQKIGATTVVSLYFTIVNFLHLPSQSESGKNKPWLLLARPPPPPPRDLPFIEKFP